MIAHLLANPVIDGTAAAAFFARRQLIPRTWRSWWRRGRPRPHIPDRLRYRVQRADRWQCVYCGYHYDLQLDHVRPWSAGGLSSLWNLVTLCGTCNRAKSNYWRYRSGRIIYRAYTADGAERMPSRSEIAGAALILAAERHARLSPLRWARAFW
jgi:HNH endonuclease